MSYRSTRSARTAGGSTSGCGSITGGTVHAELQRGPLLPTRALIIFGQLCGALAALHRRGPDAPRRETRERAAVRPAPCRPRLPRRLRADRAGHRSARRHVRRHSELRVSGASARPADQPAVGRLLADLRAVRAALRPPAVRRAAHRGDHRAPAWPTAVAGEGDRAAGPHRPGHRRRACTPIRIVARPARSSWPTPRRRPSPVADVSAAGAARPLRTRRDSSDQARPFA